MQVDTPDPLDWTVDEVVNFLCHNSDQPWSRSATGGPRPDPTSFETALRDNFVTGEVLLHDVHKTELREDLGLKTLGHVSSMLRAIRYLQDNSLKFKGSRGYPHSLEDRQSDQFSTPFSPMGVAPHLSSTVRPESGHTPRDITPIRVDSRTHILAMSPSARIKPHNREAALTNSPAKNQVTIPPEPTPNPVLEPRQTPVAEPDLSLVKRGEASNPSLYAQSRGHITVDSSGKKRLRLDPQSSAKVQDHKQSSNAADAQDGKVWYMGPERISHSDVFYSPGLDDNVRSFMMLGSEVPTAKRHFVNKSLSHFYQQPPIKLTSGKNGKDPTQWAVTPYSSKMVNADNPKLFTLYTSDKGKVTVRKEQMNNWPQFNTLKPKSHNDSTEMTDRHDPYARLLQRYPPQEDQDIFPLYGDSGSEGEYDEAILQEMQDEQQETVPYQLTQNEMRGIIADCISDYKAKWRQNGQEKEQAKVQKLWLTARRTKSTNQKIKALNHETILLGKRLEKLQEHICDSTYSARAELSDQCQSMEQTVMDIEKSKWRAAILEQETCPPKTSTPPRRPYAFKPRRNLEDEESLQSDSDYLTSDNSYDFIDDTSAVGEASREEDIPMTTPSTSDSDDDIISPSGTRRNSRKLRRLPFRESSSPIPSPKHDAMASVIDLTVESPPPEDLKIETPPLNPVQLVVAKSHEDPFVTNRTSPSISPEPRLGQNISVEIPVKAIDPPRDPQSRTPPFNDLKGIKQMSWELLEERKDRGRLLIKLLCSLPDGERENLADTIPKSNQERLRENISIALKRFLQGQECMPNLEESESKTIMRTASLYISWVNCTHLQRKKGIPKHLVENTQEDLPQGFSQFFEELTKRLRFPFSPWRHSPNFPGDSREFQQSKKHISAIDRLEQQDANQMATPHKKRKREIKESQAVKSNQQSARMRVQLNEEQKRKLEQKMESMGVSNNDPAHQAVSFREPIIYLDPHIGSRVMPHQLSGIQFMWRELLEDEKGQGCLLAHTMGLGKTMQVISLLATISAAASSNASDVRQQVPPDIRESKTLVLSPVTLIENWYEEFIMWCPPDSPIGPLRKVTSSTAVEERFQTLVDWDAEGGVLIMGYELFRSWVLNKKSVKRDKSTISDEDHHKVRTMLLEGPNIVVADEAHKMKNASSGIARATMQFRTTRRIALTGSPLANNLVDYYTMVNWIAKDYLGEFVEFKANFVEPIEEGLYADSTRWERRRSLIKLKALNNNLEPKLNRADITVLEGSLPPKTEFVLTIPLTPLQKAAYDLYVESTLEGANECVQNTNVWSWLAVLSLCNNHPACFRQKLLDRARDVQNPDEEPEGSPEAEQIPEAPLPYADNFMSKQKKLFATISDMNALELSYRAQILDRIITESFNAGDKLLVFSHSIPTLDYIERMLKMTGRKYRRLDGQTPIQSRQTATKNFNHGSEEYVYLISTRAGGLGLNIPGANRVVIFDFGFSPMWEQQAVGRVYRLGQKKPVFIYRFIAGGTFEEMIYNRAMFKTQLAFRVVDKKNPIRAATKPMKGYLFPVKAVPETDTSEFLGKDPQVLDKILNDKDTYPIRKITLTKTLERDDNDKLSLEEEQRVQEEINDMTLRRTNPVAYQRLLEERQRPYLAAARADAAASPYTSYSTPYPQPNMPSASIPYNSPNVGLYQPQQQQWQYEQGQYHQGQYEQGQFDQGQYLPQYQQQPLPLPAPRVVPSNAHNDGPPPLAPDMISYND
ncbi:putative SNF2 family helicase/ATPase [Aspergillus affinis]|uniref:putative SNF2 family helicase/ATPase n=1 Tax=Aspergillus affinis TaxID=1070780 RepID=UPI0022FEDC0D|nr:uncharacterized protein KD926_006547 [Aspergillus affinis]KAI9041649.1 hypothetical protein KD926_006547 [Aspergillus affinis]